MRIIIRGRIILHFKRVLWLKKQTSLRVLGERIRRVRKKKWLSQEDLALQADIDPQLHGRGRAGSAESLLQETVPHRPRNRL